MSLSDLDLSNDQPNPIRSYTFQTALYPTKKPGVQFGYEADRSGNAVEDDYSLGVGRFFRRNLAFELSLSRQKLALPAPFDDLESKSFRIVGRF